MLSPFTIRPSSSYMLSLRLCSKDCKSIIRRTLIIRSDHPLAWWSGLLKMYIYIAYNYRTNILLTMSLITREHVCSLLITHWNPISTHLLLKISPLHHIPQAFIEHQISLTSLFQFVYICYKYIKHNQTNISIFSSSLCIFW